MSESRRIRITHIHPASAHYKNRAEIIGLTGNFEPEPMAHYPGYWAGHFHPDGRKDDWYFFLAVRYRRI